MPFLKTPFLDLFSYFPFFPLSFKSKITKNKNNNCIIYGHINKGLFLSERVELCPTFCPLPAL